MTGVQTCALPISRWDPGIIFLVAYRQNLSRIQERLAENAVWQSLTAVGLGNAYSVPVDFYSWDQPDVRWILGLQWMASVLQPEGFPLSGLRESIYEFYRFLYGMNEEQTNQIIFSILEGDSLPEPGN